MLRIVGRRPDGYHELQTVFQFLDLADELYFRVRTDGLIVRRKGAPGVRPEDDLVVKAARALQAFANCGLGADIDVIKHLPLGGGLGGGSSDAATVLAALNRLWGARVSTTDLAQLGLTLGADVPVFLFGRAAWAEGVGEKLEPISLPEPWYLVLHPASHVSTAEVFIDPELTRNSKPIKIRDFLAGDRRNDCLNVVTRRFSAVRNAMAWLNGHADAQLTGTGACIFAPFSSRAAAEVVATNAPEGLVTYIAKGVNVSPLHSKLER